MILDKLKNISDYQYPGEKIKRALAFICNEARTMDITREYDLGDGVYAFCATYCPASVQQGILEAHRRYIDVMFMKSGSEQIGYKPVENLKNIVQEYDKESDALLAKDEDAKIFDFPEDYFAVWLPQDAHMPGISVESHEEMVQRVIVKVPVE